MKRLISIIICLLFSVMVFAQEGVKFRDLTFEEALAVAKAEKKMLFVDCYAYWCGPCKHMTNVVFPQKEVGDYFNSRFVCVKYDMAKGEGEGVSEKWDVKAYPTFLMIRPNGELQHVVVGGDDWVNFFPLVEKGLKEKTSFTYLDGRYKQGKMNKKELLAYVTALRDAYLIKDSEKVQKELMGKLSDAEKLKKEYWPLFENVVVGSEDFDFVLAHFQRFQKNVGDATIDNFIKNAYDKAFFKLVVSTNQNENLDMAKIKEQLNALNTDCREDLLFSYRIVEDCLNENLEDLLNELDAHKNNLSSNDLKLVAGAFPKLQKKATKAELAKMAIFSEQIAAKQEKGRLKDSWEVLAETYKSLSKVGVYFEELSLEEALAKAKKMRKKVFVDCYTSWCGPCRMVANQVFPQEKIGDEMNARFINVKYDMEVGAGVDIEKKYNVRAYPTFLILNPDGTVYHKLVGAYPADEFMQEIATGMRPENSFGYLDEQYQKGNREKRFLTKYLKLLVSLHERAVRQKVLEELLVILTDEEKMSESYWFIFENANMAPFGSENMAFVVKNHEQFKKNIGVEKVEQHLFDIYYKQIERIISRGRHKNNELELAQIQKDLEVLKLSNQQVLFSNLKIAKAVLANNSHNQVLTISEKEVDRLPAEYFPYVALINYHDRIATPVQRNRWIKLGKKLLNKVQVQRDKSVIEKTVKRLEDKKTK